MSSSQLVADAFGVFACAGIGQAMVGYFGVRRFRNRLKRPAESLRPPMTILKPLCGDEPLLEQALASICALDYPVFQVVFGVHGVDDAAIAVVGRIRRRFPSCDIALVIDASSHGLNRKVGNLMNMLPAAKYDLLVIGDSDVHVTPDYLDRIAVEFARPGTGLVTTLYSGAPANRSLAATLGATWLSHGFLPGALMARALGRQDTLGVTMALHRGTLDAIGGLAALVPHLADDHALGRLVRQQGLDVRLAATVTSTTVPEDTLAALFSHELRWSRTVLSLEPVGFALSAMQFPLFWSALAYAVSGGCEWFACMFLVAWVVRASCAIGIDHTLGLSRSVRASPPPIWLLPLRDLFSMSVMLASYGGDRVVWRGRTMHTRATPTLDDIAYVPPNNAPAATAG